MTVEYGWAKDESRKHCAVDPDNPGRMLCGRKVGYVPGFQGAFDPKFMHPRCAELLAARTEPVPAQPLTDIGDCPVCGGSVDLDTDGLVVRHGQHVMRGGRQVVSETQCDGVGRNPEVEG